MDAVLRAEHPTACEYLIFYLKINILEWKFIYELLNSS